MGSATYSRIHRVAFKAVLQEWDSGHPCTHCGRVWLYSASTGLRKKCCMEGKLWDLNMSPFILAPLPPVLESGFYNPEFVRSSNQYNNILSLGAVGVENAKEARGWDKIVGHHAVRLSGRTYHFLPQVNTRGGLQYILHDGSQGPLTSVGRERQVDEATLMELYEDLEANNPLFKAYAAIGSMADRLLLQFGEDVPPEQVNTILPQLNRATVEFDVSAITIDRMTGNRFFRVKVKGSPSSCAIPSTSELFEPIGYPLLFPRGETGWGETFRKGQNELEQVCMKIEFLDYLASRMLMPERHLDFEATELDPGSEIQDDPNWGRFGRVCTKLHSQETFFMPTNRFERNHRLGQIYLVDMTSRAIDHRLNFVKANQKHMFGGVARHDEGIDDNSDDDIPPQPDQVVQYGIIGDHIGRLSARGRGRGRGRRGGRLQTGARSTAVTVSDVPIDPYSKPCFLGDSFHGSKRHLKKLAINALHLVQCKGQSHLFITLTCNKKWPEFTEVLWPGADVFDMPGIVCQVFHAKLKALLHNLRHGKYFGGDPTEYLLHVIEYQVNCRNYLLKLY